MGKVLCRISSQNRTLMGPVSCTKRKQTMTVRRLQPPTVSLSPILEDFNKNTWSWNGCKLLWVGVNMCLSTGSAPMPAPVTNAVCGPTVPRTQKPASGTNLTTLNLCPLKVCCNTWGQCGTTANFCVISKSETGAPGTSAKGTNWCIANCGMDIVSSGKPAANIKVTYFESSATSHWESMVLLTILAIL